MRGERLITGCNAGGRGGWCAFSASASAALASVAGRRVVRRQSRVVAGYHPDAQPVHHEFFAKAEIARWPVVGWLSTGAGTIYHQRSAHSLGAVMERVWRVCAKARRSACSEGGTGLATGENVSRAIFQVAVDADVPVQPVALCYGDGGRMDLRVPFGSTESFGANFLRLLGGPGRRRKCIFSKRCRCMVTGGGRLPSARANIAQALGCADTDPGSDFQPTPWLRNPHVQSVLASVAPAPLATARATHGIGADGGRTHPRLRQRRASARLPFTPDWAQPTARVGRWLARWEGSAQSTTWGTRPAACSPKVATCSG